MYASVQSQRLYQGEAAADQAELDEQFMATEGQLDYED